MISLTDLKELFLKYQKTRNPDDYADMISNSDYLIVYFISKCRKRLNYLRRVESRDLYHDSILALHNAAITFPAKMKCEYIPCRLQAYILNEFRKYRHNELENVELDQSEYGRKDLTDGINTNKIDYDTILKALSTVEAELLEEYYSGNKVREIAKKRGVSLPRISDKVKGIVKKLKR